MYSYTTIVVLTTCILCSASTSTQEGQNPETHVKALFPIPLEQTRVKPRWPNHLVSLPLRWGYVDDKGVVVVPAKYDFAGRFQDGLAHVIGDGKHGYVNLMGKEVVPLKYDDCGPFSEGIAAVYQNGAGWGFVDKRGHVMIKPQFGVVTQFGSGLAGFAAKSPVSKWGEPPVDVGGYMDRTGEIVIKPQFQHLHAFSDGLALVKGYGGREPRFIDAKGNVAIKLDGFRRAHPFSEGLAVVEAASGRYGYLDKAGRTAVEPDYDEARSFSEGMAAVKRGELWGYIKTDGSVAITPQYAEPDLLASAFGTTNAFSDGLAWVRNKEGRYQAIDRTGKVIITGSKGTIYKPFLDGMAEFIAFEGKGPELQSVTIGFIDKRGQVKLSKVYDIPRTE